MTLEGGSFSSPEFKEFSKKVVPFLHVTTHIEGRRNDDLLMRKSGRAAFPAMIIMDDAGTPLYTFTRAATCAWLAGGPLPVGVLAKKLAMCERYVALSRRAAAGDKSVKVDLAVAATDIGRLDPYQLERELEGVTLTAAQKRTVRQAKVNGLCERFVATLRARGSSQMIQKGIEAELLAIYEAGTHPTSDAVATYWWVVGKHGLENRDKKMLAEGIRGIEAAPGGSVAFKDHLDRWKTALKDL